MTEGRKDDAGKPRPTLVMRTMANALQRVVQVAEYGARKYSPDNWLQVPDASQRYTDAMLRHQQAHLRGEVLDPESGLPHMAHAAWCALAVLELGARKAQPLFAAVLRELRTGQPQLSDRAAFEERYWDWTIPTRNDAERADLAEVNRQLRKDPEVRRILNEQGVPLRRTRSGTILAGNAVNGDSVPTFGFVMGPERTPAEYRKGRKAIRRLERATNPLASQARGLPLYEAALDEGLLYLQGPSTIAIKDRRGQKLREVHGKTLLGAWALLKQMPDVENLLKTVTARVPVQTPAPALTKVGLWRAELAKDPVCAEGLAKGWLRVRAAPDGTGLIMEATRTSGPPLWYYGRDVTPSAIDWVMRVRPEPTTLRDLAYAHPDTRLRQLFDAGKLTCTTTTGGWRVSLGNRQSAALTLKAAFEVLVSDRAFVEREAAKLPKPQAEDRAIAHWTRELSRDDICARMLATRQLQLIHEPRGMWLRRRTSMFPLHCNTAAKAIRWVHDGLRT